MKRLNKNAIKRGQSRTCLNYAECKHFGRSQTKGMYALLMAVAAMIGITIYGSCSADEDYGCHFDQELSTRAERLMRREQETGPSLPFPTVDEILANKAVCDTLDMIWEETKSLAGPTQRQEIGVFIRYDRTTGKFSFGDKKYGPPVNCSQYGYVDDSPKYWQDRCAYFHTHTTFQYCSNVQRKTIPSKMDSNFVNTLHIPGIIYDYNIDELKGGMSKDMEKKVLKYGVDRRTN